MLDEVKQQRNKREQERFPISLYEKKKIFYFFFW